MSDTQSIITGSNPRTFALTGCIRVCQGITVAAVIVQGAASVSSTDEWLFPPLIAAGLLCGMAAGYLWDSLLVGKGPRAAIVTQLSCLLIGACFATQQNLNILLIAGLFTGLGCAADGTLLSVSADSLPNARRWKGMRVWASLFSIGLLVGVWLTLSSVTLFTVVGLCALLTCMALIQLPAEPHACTESSSCDLPTDTSCAPTAAVESCQNDSPDECEETECCGGGAREFERPSFMNGLILVFASAALFWGPIRTLIETSGSSESLWPGGATAAGLFIGTWLVISAAPATGYAVVCLPFLLGVAVFCPLAGLLEPGIVGGIVLSALCGLSCGGAATALSRMITELFSSGCTDKDVPQELSQCTGIRELGSHQSRLELARMRMVGLFLAAAVLLGFDLFRMVVTLPQQLLAFEAAIAIVAILAVRAVPVPVMSSLGRDDDAGQHDDELQDVLAAIEQPVQ